MYEIITDSTSNLTEDMLLDHNIIMISYICDIDGEEYNCYEPGRDDEQDGKFFYDKMRSGADVTTSLINSGIMMNEFEKSFKLGRDVLFIGMSSGLTGSCESALIAAEELNEYYPDRKCIVVDSLAASFGEGFLVLRAADLRAEGRAIEEAASWVEDNRLKMRHIFTVENLKYLRRGGRISGATSLIGNALGVKPVLYATKEGTIDVHAVSRGRKKSLNALVEDFKKYADMNDTKYIGIAHCDCKDDALYIQNEILADNPDLDIIIRVYDRCSGTHVGPGAICIFFMGNNRDF